MANKRKTTTEAAMSAVERALDLDDALSADGAGEARKEPGFGSAAKRSASKNRDDEAVLGDFARAMSESDDTPIADIAAANDDRPNIETLLYRLQRRPSSAPFMVAGLLGAV